MGEAVKFNGITFRRYPDSPHLAHRNYYTPGIADKQRGVQLLHIEIWKTHNGPVPDGCEIHHADFNPLNNDPDNLVCLTIAEHKEAHREQGRARGRTPERLEHMDRIRPLTVAWHGSDEGREWHRQHAAEMGFGARGIRPAVCDQCGADFVDPSPSGHSRFCSNNCKSAFRRASGVDNVPRICARCRAEFMVNKYSVQKHCGRECAQRARYGAKV